nr:MAG TPA: tail protein [Caudoviricetes sp.]
MTDVRYVNSNNQSINLLADKLRVTSGTLHDRKWKTSSDDLYPEEVDKESVTYDLTITLRGSLESRKQQLDDMCDLFEYDLVNKQLGRLYFGSYYIRCYILTSRTGVSSTFNNWTDVAVGVYCPKQQWIRENAFSFLKEDDLQAQTDDSKTYSYSYSYVYGKASGVDTISVDSLKNCDFLMRIYGAVSSPSVEIAGHLYNVDCEIASGEYLVIDSINSEIYIVGLTGKKTNVFNSRNKESNVFEKIKPGLNAITWSAGFGFDLIVYDERGEPRWI